MTHGEAVNWIINLSADIGKAEHRDLWHYAQALCEIREMLEGEPERKIGKWVCYDEFIDCSACRQEKWSRTPYESLVKRFRYCPNCGAKMEEEG